MIRSKNTQILLNFPGHQNTVYCLEMYSRVLTNLENKSLENIMGKGENAFLLFSQCFLPFPKQIPIFLPLLCCCLLVFFNLDWSKILLFGTGSNIPGCEQRSIRLSTLPEYALASNKWP